jgi:carboxymethylenebutenolidase
MCFDVDSQPPIPHLHGAVVRNEELVLAAVDGARFNAFAAHGDSVTPSNAAIVVMPDVRGLFSFYCELAQRFAEAGIDAIAIDYFGRTAGLEPRDDSFDYMPHVMQTKSETVNMDVASAVAYLRGVPGARSRAIFTVGFCFGGHQSFLQAANHHGLAGVIGFYGSPMPRKGATVGPMQRVGEFECPVLGLFGGTDEGIPQESINAFDEALTSARIDHQLIVYPNAPHSFFDRKQESFQQESADAWQKMLSFIGAHTPSTGQATAQA